MERDGRMRPRIAGKRRPVATEISAGGVLFEDGKILILCKPNGEWIMPKGHVEPDETVEQAALREVSEETGLLAQICGRLGETQYEFRVSSTGQVHRKRVHWFLMEVAGGDLNIEPTFCGGKFLTVDEALKTLTFQNDREIVQRAVRTRREKRKQ